ncbi:MAG: tubulin-like doman-containing protein [Rikenellaceae bacterium]
MATKLRKCLYIGLGGTGMSALLRTKKMFIDNYGEVPPMIGFLGIDTDSAAYSKSIPSKYGTVSLLPSEQCSITVSNPRAYFKRHRNLGKLTWLPDENIAAINTLTEGAGQIRTNGRLAFVHNVQKLATKIESSLSNISNAKIIENAKYEILDAETEVHMVFSICGGTGCGTFIDTAYLIQSLDSAVKVVGYAVLPNVFNEMVKGVAMRFTKPNALGAIKDLDYFMRLNEASPEIELDWDKRSYRTNQRPFSAINLIDNKNEGGSVYQHVDDLSDMISLALVSVAGEIGANGASVADNVKNFIDEGGCAIDDKTAWFSTLGTSEIVFRGSDVARVYSLKSAMKLINNLSSTTEDGATEATNWIDDPSVNIRENNGKDNVIDKIVEGIRPQYSPVITTPASAATDAAVFLKGYLPTDAQFTTAVAAMTDNVTAKLQQKVESLIQRPAGGGLKLAEDMLKSIKYNIDELFKLEMVEEQRDLEQRVPVFEQQLDTTCADLTEYARGLFSRKSVVADKTNDVVDAAVACGENALEIKRRIYAIQFYNAISGKVTEHLDKVENLSNLFSSVYEDISREVSKIQNAAVDDNAVRIDLSSSVVRGVEVGGILLSQFANSLGALSIYSLSTKEAIASALKVYCDSLSAVQEWDGRTIDDVLNKMTQAELVRQINIVRHKAKPMMKINDHGHTFDDDNVCRGYLVCVPDKVTNALTKTDADDGQSLFEKNSDRPNTSYISTGLTDRVIIYRQEYAYPAFVIQSLDSCQPPYEEKGPIRFHFDANIYNLMVRNKFKLEPTADTAVADAALMLWVKAFIFGLVKFETGKYWYIDKENGRALKNYWLSTDQRDRDQAYKVFTEKAVNLQEQYDAHFEAESSKMGTEKFNELIDDVKANYLTKYSQLNITVETLETRGYEAILALIENELGYVEKTLSKR